MNKIKITWLNWILGSIIWYNLSFNFFFLSLKKKKKNLSAPYDNLTSWVITQTSSSDLDTYDT